MVLSSAFCHAQSVDTTKFHIRHVVDRMTDKDYYIASIGLVCSPDGKKGFRIKPDFLARRGPVAYNGLSVISVGIGNCVENCELIFLFEDGTKVNSTSWNKFNCDGNSYFDYNKTLLDKMAKPLKAVRFTNGNGFESYTHSVEAKNKNYFIEVKNAIDNQMVIDKGFIE